MRLEKEDINESSHGMGTRFISLLESTSRKFNKVYLTYNEYYIKILCFGFSEDFVIDDDTDSESVYKKFENIIDSISYLSNRTEHSAIEYREESSSESSLFYISKEEMEHVGEPNTCERELGCEGLLLKITNNVSDEQIQKWVYSAMIHDFASNSDLYVDEHNVTYEQIQNIDFHGKIRLYSHGELWNENLYEHH